WAKNRPAAGGAHSIPTRLFPTDNWWNLKISQAPVDTRSASYITGLNGVGPSYDWGNNYGLPYTTTPSSGGSMKLFDSGSGLSRMVTVESTGLFRLVFEAG